jgi:hypothetical protein
MYDEIYEYDDESEYEDESESEYESDDKFQHKKQNFNEDLPVFLDTDVKVNAKQYTINPLINHEKKEILSLDASNKTSLYIHTHTYKNSDKMTKDEQLSVRINLLPCDIKRKIFNDYIRIDYLAIQYKLETRTRESQSLQPEKLLLRWLKMKTIPNLIRYLKINDDIFKKLYHQHYVLNDKNFRNMDTDKSFIVSILFTLYH